MSSTHASVRPFPALLLGAAGGALVGGRPRQSRAGTLSALAGIALVGVAASGPVAEALRRAGTRRRTAHLRLSFVVSHPVSTVFRFCADFENFPRFIRGLHQVQDFGDGRSHWVGSALGGDVVEWDAVTTKFVPNRVIAWQSTPNAPVRTSCSVRVSPERTGGTCVRVAIDYAVPIERVKDAVAALASRARTRELEHDIRQLGAQIERQSQPSDATV